MLYKSTFTYFLTTIANSKINSACGTLNQVSATVKTISQN